MTGARLRSVSVLVLLLLDGLVILAWSQRWLVARSDGRTVPVPGSDAGAAELPLALTGLALIAALLIAGPVFRVILAVLQALLGACIAIAAGLVLADPASAVRTEVARATGLTGGSPDAAATPTGWPAVALVGGILLVLTGLAVAATVRRWPRTTSRFERTRTAPAEGEERAERPPAGAVDDWDALSDGDDPTDPSR